MPCRMTPTGGYLSGAFGQTRKEQARRMMASALAKWQRTGAAMKPVPRDELPLYGGAEPTPGSMKLRVAYRDLPRGSVRRPNTAYIQNPYNLGWFDLTAAEASSLRTVSDEPVAIPASLYQKLATKTLKDAVRGQMHWLVQNISPMEHLDYLYSQKALNEEEYQTIYAEKAEATKVTKHD